MQLIIVEYYQGMLILQNPSTKIGKLTLFVKTKYYDFKAFINIYSVCYFGF